MKVRDLHPGLALDLFKVLADRDAVLDVGQAELRPGVLDQVGRQGFKKFPRSAMKTSTCSRTHDMRR